MAGLFRSYPKQNGRRLPGGRSLFRSGPRLPDADAVRRRDVELVARLDVPGLVPGVEVAQRRDRSDLARRMRIADQLLAQSFGALQRPPHLAPAEEDALVAGE